MQQLAQRSPSLSGVPAILKVVKRFGLHRLLPLSTKLLSSLPRLRRVRKPQEEIAEDFLLIISMKYEWWTDSSGNSMQLNTVRNDVKAILDHIDYQHDNKDGRCYYFLMDYDLEYTDSSGTTKPLPRTGLPTREIILDTLEKATLGGSSGLIHYSGHCHSKAPGTSGLMVKSDCVIYDETEDLRRGVRAAYLISCDGKRIYGHEFYRSLHNTSADVGGSIITLILDTCKAEGFIQGFGDLAFIYNAGFVETIPTAPVRSTPPLGQLVVVTAARANELAWTVNDSGILTYFLTQCLRNNPNALANDVVKYLGEKCRGQPDETKLQRPRVWSRHRLTGPFRLIPRSALELMDASPPSDSHSWLGSWVASATEYALSLQAFRPMTLSHLLV